MTKKIFCLILSLLLPLLSSCSAESSIAEKDITTTEQSTTSTTVETTTEPQIYKTGEEFFDDVVFVGDSISMGLENYVTSQRNSGSECLGKAKFLVAGSMGYANTLKEISDEYSIHPQYNGKDVKIEDGIKLIGAKKAFILLGMNDFYYPAETVIKNAKTLIKLIVEKNPDVKIYIQSITPILKKREYGRLTNSNIDSLNKSMENLCKENGWTYVDISTVLKDENNSFKSEYCCDPGVQGIHMAYSGCRVWVDCLENKFCKENN